MEYICKVGTPAGEIVERSFDAPNEEALKADLQRQGLFLFSHKKATQGFRFGAPRVKPENLQLFGQELAALLKAGLPLTQSMDLMVERQRDPLFKRSLAAVRDRIKSGSALSEAFRHEGSLYPQMFAASLVAGERSGNLEAVLRRFVSYVRLNQAIKKKVISASVYPMVLFSGMFGLMYVMLTRVLPQFTDFYGSLGAQLPLPTRVLMGISEQARQWSLPLLAVLALGGFAFASWLQVPSNREKFDGWILRIPFFGALMRTYSTSQLARSLSTLLSGGLPPGAGPRRRLRVGGESRHLRRGLRRGAPDPAGQEPLSRPGRDRPCRAPHRRDDPSGREHRRPGRDAQPGRGFL